MAVPGMYPYYGFQTAAKAPLPAPAAKKARKSRVTMNACDISPRFKALPITLLSGFLGSGKTTLLSYVLNSKSHGLKIAIIVNDMAAVNVDEGIIVADSKKKGREAEKMIAMQNGCICCTLRGDFVIELAKMARAGEYDYVIIESTGISEPQQVAESFTANFTEAMMNADGALDQFDEEEKKVFNEIAEAGGLNKIAKLDTTVTVLDGFRFFEEFETIQLLHERFESEVETPEDQRTVSDLMIDQIEFADVIIVNKIDMIDDDMLLRIRGLIRTLNPGAKVLETSLRLSKQSENPHGVIPLDVREIIATGLYSEETSVKSVGWLKSLQDMSMIDNFGRKVLAPKPETLEYGINSFVYRARKPFHPGRLYELVHDKFVILEPQEEEEEEEVEEESEGEGTLPHPKTDDTSVSSNSSAPQAKYPDPPITTRLANKKSHPIFKSLLRSKGFIWLATRPYVSGDWSQAGAMLTVSGGLNWFACVPSEQWHSPSEDVTELIKKDFEGEWGDRRQEVVFIGEGIDVNSIKGRFDECLLSDSEMEQWETAMRKEGLTDEEREGLLCDAFDDGWGTGQTR
ncbi:hypothetical protein H2203_003139 [Taxawa tesnikishii (nom. ined.)]|nr:hypothetical protein H2203_003139 [Dothideales sp. JES 119]